jgi:hypothetical protein
MKKIFLLATALITQFGISYSQNISDLGRKSFYEIKAMEKMEPCEITIGKALTYCVEDGSKITYVFENNILRGVMFLTPFLSKSEAESELKKTVNNFATRNSIKPVLENGSATFYNLEIPLSVSYGLKDLSGTTYLFYFTLLLNK